jgi:hypothetical protein
MQQCVKRAGSAPPGFDIGRVIRHNAAAEAAVDVNAHLALTVPWIAELVAVLTSHLRGLDHIIN